MHQLCIKHASTNGINVDDITGNCRGQKKYFYNLKLATDLEETLATLILLIDIQDCFAKTCKYCISCYHKRTT